MEKEKMLKVTLEVLVQEQLKGKTINQIRHDYGLKPIEGGDLILQK